MLVIDNFFPEELINSVIAEANQQEWQFRRSDTDEDIYWAKYIFGITYNPNKQFFIQEFVSENVKQCWEFFKSKTNCILDNNLETVYFNGLTHGIEAHAHVDSHTKNFTTVIIYVCENWNSHWGGETVFFNGEYSKNPADNIFYSHDIVKSVLPKYNRIVLFDGKTVHAVRPISKTFKGLRKTLMFKIKDKNVEEFKKLCS
jgi:hypothetical protein